MQIKGITSGIIMAVTVATLSVGATECVWKGGASSDWQAAANWDPSVPAATDTAVFTATASVAVPGSFAGTLFVNNATVTLSIADTTRFELRTAGDARVVKRGDGVLTVQPYRGVNPGAIEVAEGTMLFAGNGAEAPGAFGALVVRDTAVARIVESPATSRHGAVYHGGQVSSYTWDSVIKCTWQQFDEDLWLGADLQTNAWNGTINLTDTTKALCNGSACVPAEYVAAKRNWRLYMRALVVAERGIAAAHTMTCGDRWSLAAIAFLDGVQKQYLGYDKGTSSVKWTAPTRGFHEMGISHFARRNEYSDNYFTFSHDPLCTGDAGTLTADVLWLGVCFNGVTVDAGGTLSVAADQALGLACAEQCAFNGTVTADGATAWLSFLSGIAHLDNASDTLSLAGLRDFAGKVELGRTVLAAFPETGDVAFQVTGLGIVTVPADAYLAAIADGFDGSLNVPAGSALVIPARLKNCPVTGSGAVTLPVGAAQPVGFTGTLAFADATDAGIGAYAGGGVQGLTLSDQGTYAIDLYGLYDARRKAIDSCTNAAAWFYVGKTVDSGAKTPKGGSFGARADSKPYVTNDTTLVLTDGPAKQRHGIFLTNVVLTADTTLDASFKVKAYMTSQYMDMPNTGWQYQLRSGSFSIVLENTTPGVFLDDSLLSVGAFGTTLEFYDKGALHTIAAGGSERSYTGLEDVMGFPFSEEKPNFDVKMHLERGLLRLTFSQDGIAKTIEQDVTPVFAGGKTATLALLGSTSWWGTGALPWIRLELTDFVGAWTPKTVDRVASEPAAEMAATSDNWAVSNSSVWDPDDATKIRLFPKATKSAGAAVCKTPVSLADPFVFSFDVTYGASSVDENPSPTESRMFHQFYLQTEGTNPVLGSKGGSENNYKLTAYTYSYGFVCCTQGGLFNWFYGMSDKSPYVTEVDATSNVLQWKTNVTYRYTVRYDGLGAMTAELKSYKPALSKTYRFADLAKATNLAPRWYLTFGGRTATWGYPAPFWLSNFSFVRQAYVDPGTVEYATPLTVPANADVTLSTGAFSTNATAVALNFKDVTLSAASKLTVVPSCRYSKMAFSNIQLAGNAALAVHDGAVAVIGKVTVAAEPISKLTVTGCVAFADPFVVVVPSSTKAKNIRAAVVNFAGATLVGSFPTQLCVQDENGKNLGAFRIIRTSANEIKISNGGFLVIIH